MGWGGADVLEQQESTACNFTRLNCEAESIFDYAAFHFCRMYENGLEWLSFIVLVRPCPLPTRTCACAGDLACSLCGTDTPRRRPVC
jgi:hypothetical protein